MFLSRNYQQIVAPRKFDILKTNICTRNEALRANMLVLRTSNFLGATIRPIVPRHKHSIVVIVLHYFFPRASSFIILNYFQLFRWKPLKSNVKFEKQNRQKSTWYNFNSLFSISLLVCRKMFTDEYITIHPGIFHGRAIWADSVSPRMNPIASRDQFKPIRIGENLVVNCNSK